MSTPTFRERLEDAFKADHGDRPQAWTSHGVESGTFMAGARAALETLANMNCEAARLLPKPNRIAQVCADERVKDAEMFRALARELEANDG